MSWDRIEGLGARLGRAEAQRGLLLSMLKRYRQDLEQKQKEAEQYEKALSVLQSLEQEWRERFEEQIAAVLSWGLSAVFGTKLSVRIKTEIKRGVSNTKVTVEEGGVETDILDYEGGSLVNVLTVLLRILLTVSMVPPQRRFLVLDEPFSMVSVEYRPALCQLLRELAHRYGLQFLIVSHEPELVEAADVAYLVEKKQGRAEIKPIKRREETQL